MIFNFLSVALTMIVEQMYHILPRIVNWSGGPSVVEQMFLSTNDLLPCSGGPSWRTTSSGETTWIKFGSIKVRTAFSSTSGRPREISVSFEEQRIMIIFFLCSKN